MKLHNATLALRTQIARAVTMATTSEPLRFVVRRKVPLARGGELLGHLDMLLRLSCHGSGEGNGVLVFDWPTGASEHSAVQMLEGWSSRSSESAVCKEGVLEVERRDSAMHAEGSDEVPGVHLKVRFPLSEIPDALLELLGLAARAGFADAVRSELERRQEPADAVPEGGDGDDTGAQPAKAVSAQEQAMIDNITPNAVFDPKVHPRVNPNEEVRKSDGTKFRLIMKRMGGAPRRTWIHVPEGARTASRRS